jgi:O-antigen ligase
MPSSSLLENKNSLILYALTGLYLVVSTIAIVKGYLLFLMLPLALIIVLVSVTRLDKIFLFIGLITPLSINLAQTSLGIGVSLPSEPIIFGVMLLYLFRILHDGGIDKKLLYHPVSLAIIFHLAWMLLTTFTSTMLIVSFKHTLARFSFVMVFYFLGTQVFRKFKDINRFLWSYALMFTVVIGYTVINHAAFGFSEKASHTSMVPFYNDHTAYAAVSAMFIPVFIGMVFNKDIKKWVRWTAGLFLIIFIESLVLSYTRASWVSLIAALLCYFVFLFKIKTWLVMSLMALVVGLYFIFQTNITMELERNDEQSSSDYASHVQSASNITTDASNLERLNRWNSAWKMFMAKPVFGWGPGTYMFNYAPFQKIDEKTIISTNSGEGGNAHSEYIGPLAEQGFMGSIAFIVIGILVILNTSRFIKNCSDNNLKILAKSLILGLVTYWVHGMLNNFLDTEKASVLFWGFIAALISLDLYHNSKDKDLINSSTELK